MSRPRKMKLGWADLSVAGATQQGCAVFLKVSNAKGSTVQASGFMNKYQLQSMARASITGLAQILAAEESNAEVTRRMIANLKGGAS